MFPQEKFEPRQLFLVWILCLSALLPFRSLAETAVTLTVQATSNPAVTGYTIYYGTVSGQYTNQVPVGDVNQVTISGLIPGQTYYFAATSHDAQNNESAYSPEISYTLLIPKVPEILGLLSTNSAEAGENLIFAIGASGTGQLEYQWIYDNNPIASATNSILVLPNISTSQSGNYYVTVSDASGGTTNSPAVALTVYPANPTTGPLLAAPTLAPGGPSFTISGISNYQYVVLASTNLTDWAPIATNISPFTFVDSNANQFRYRFYRSSFTAPAGSGGSGNDNNGLVAWYPLAGNLNDYSGYGNNATGSGTIAYTAGPLTNENTALAFDGTDTYAYVNNASDLITNSTGFSISGWLDIQDTNASYGGFGLRSQADGPGAFFINVLATGVYQARFRNVYGSPTDIYVPFVTNTWTFVSLTYDGSMLSFYTNGVQAASVQSADPFGPGNVTFYIGGSGYLPPDNLPDFPMAGIRMYNKALSPSDVQQLYNQGIVNGIF
jgi:hypothetical protein